MRCARCNRDLPQEAFYPSDRYRCKECHRKQKKASYDKYHPSVYVGNDGKLMKRSSGHPSIFWNGNMISDLKRHFPTTRNDELAEMLGVSPRTIVRKARELGLSKDEEWQKNVSRKNGFLGYYGNRRI